MADDKNRNLEPEGDMHGRQQDGSYQSPGRNPQDDRSAGERGDQKGGQDRGGQFDPSKGGDDGSYKEGGQNEQTRR